MRPRKRLRRGLAQALAWALVVAAWSALLGPTGASAKPRSCDRGGTTLIANERFRIYKLERSEGEFAIVSCRYRTQRRQEVASYADCGCNPADEAVTVKLAGRYGAVLKRSPGPESANRESFHFIFVFDLLDRTRLFAFKEQYNGNDKPPLIIDLVLKGTGSFAYIAYGGLYRVERRGTRKKQLDILPDSGSLALAGSRLYWTKRGQPLTARLN